MFMFSSVLSAVKIVYPPFLKNATYTEMAIITSDKTITQKKGKEPPKKLSRGLHIFKSYLYMG